VASLQAPSNVPRWSSMTRPQSSPIRARTHGSRLGHWRHSLSPSAKLCAHNLPNEYAPERNTWRCSIQTNSVVAIRNHRCTARTKPRSAAGRRDPNRPNVNAWNRKCSASSSRMRVQIDLSSIDPVASARPCNKESPALRRSPAPASAVPGPRIRAAFGTTHAPSASINRPRPVMRETGPGNNCAAALLG
jgi:hypothetical protein